MSARELLQGFQRSHLAMAGLSLLALLLLLALAAGVIAPQNPYDLAQLDITDGRLPPGEQLSSGALALLGTDDQGRDMLSAILYGQIGRAHV